MPDLPKRTLGRTGLEVTILGYGGMELRGVPRGRDVSDEQSERILNAVHDAGFNFIDTSIDSGLAEGRIGRFVAHRRSEFFLASKCGCLAGDLVKNPPPVRKGSSQRWPARCRRTCTPRRSDGSHWPDRRRSRSRPRKIRA